MSYVLCLIPEYRFRKTEEKCNTCKANDAPSLQYQFRKKMFLDSSAVPGHPNLSTFKKLTNLPVMPKNQIQMSA
jgi:hypothetical protein